MKVKKREEIRSKMLELTEKRGPDSSICPSEVVRALYDDWRPLMDTVREVAAEDTDAWDRINHLADTLTEHELTVLNSKDVLFRLFHEENTRLFDPAPLIFSCTCSRERFGAALHQLGAEELRSVLEEQGQIETQCHFCNTEYVFSPADVEALIDNPDAEPPTVH